MAKRALRVVARTCGTAAAVAGLALIAAGAASATPPSHGQLLRIVRPRTELHTNQSTNWFGYSQGTLEQAGRQFHSISGQWTVPATSAHTQGQSESSSDWVGIGGGCLDSSCTLNDNTLIQVGTEQDVDSSGKASYSAWYELVPAPSRTIKGMTVAPGDHMSASVVESPQGSETWTIALKDVTRGESFSTSTPYSSSYATAEWIEETPFVIDGVNSGLAPLPNLWTIPFDLAADDGANPNLTASEQIQLIDQNGSVIGAPSTPDPESDGFTVCAWASTCAPLPAGAASAQPSAGQPGGAGAGTTAHSTSRAFICKVPRLKGLRLVRARSALHRSHCSVGRIARRTRPGLRRSTVMSQSVKPGRRLPAWSRVALAIAR